MKTLLLFFIALTLSACGGGSSGGGSDNDNPGGGSETTKKVDLTGQWSFTSSFNTCPGLEASYVAELTDVNGKLNNLTRYTGILVDTDNCLLTGFTTETANIASFNYEALMTENNFADFVADVSAEYYELERDDISVTVTTFDDNELSYTATAIVDGETITETGSFIK